MAPGWLEKEKHAYSDDPEFITTVSLLPFIFHDLMW